MAYGMKLYEDESGRAAVRDYGRGPVRLDVIGTATRLDNGNVVLRVGRQIEPGSRAWEQTGHVVLSPAEWDAMVAEVAR